MESLPRRLEKLEEALAALPEECDAMTLGEIDGFVAGLLVCPVEIPAEEWLGLMWRDVAEDGLTPLLSAMAADALAERVHEHYRLTNLQLRAGEDGYAPIVYTEEETNAVLWDTWASGFAEAMQVRMDSWEAIAGTGDQQAIDAIIGLTSLIRIANRPDFDAPLKAEDQALSDEAPDLIPLWVETLFDWRLSYRPDPAQKPVSVVKIGRNDPCPCGSGKKYKKCCGAAEAA